MIGRGRGAARFAALGATALCALLATATPAAAAFSEFPITTPASSPAEITRGPDGNLWFTETAGNKIGRITPSGTVSEFAIPTASSAPFAITAGPDGNLWFAEYNANQIGRITPAGAITEYPTTISGAHPSGIAAGPDGNLWITMSSATQSGVIRMNTSGAFIDAFTAPHRGAAGITAGPDGNMWFAEIGDNYIAKITTGATPTIADYLIPGGYLGPEWLVTGPDGNLWFTSQHGSVGKVTTAGAITVYPVPTSNGGGIPAAGPDGNVWFTEANANQIAKITPTGTVTEYPVPTAGADPRGIVTGPDHNIWFTEEGTSSIGRFTLSAGPHPVPPFNARITKSKINQHKHHASFTYTADGVVTGFKCALVRAAPKHKKQPKPKFKPCGSSAPSKITYKKLPVGHYTFEVYAYNSVGKSNTAKKKFKI